MATAQLMNTLYLTHLTKSKEKSHSPSRSRLSSRSSKASLSRRDARLRYQFFTDCTKDQQKDIVRHQLKGKKKQWSLQHKKIHGSFSLNDNLEIDPFPSNNKKYNVQFLERSLYGTNLKNHQKGLGYFNRPADSLYSQHYIPIVRTTRMHNEDYELRTSMFDKTWVDTKRDRVMDQYTMQVNPFKTQRSNGLIARMKKEEGTFRIV